MENWQDIIQTGLETADAWDGNNWLEFLLTPGANQEKEFGQQVALQQMQNDFSIDYETKMNRMIEAGINPNVAASGLAGSGASAPSSPSVPSSTVGQGSSAIDSISKLGDTAVKAGQLGVAREQLATVDPTVQNIIADTFLKYKTAGYTDLQAQGLAIANAYLPAEKFLGIVALTQNIDNLRAQYADVLKDIDVKNKRIEEIDQEIKESVARITLVEKEALLKEKEALLVAAQTQEQNWLNSMRQQYGIDPKSPIENNLFMLGVTGNPNYETTLGIVYDTQYQKSMGAFNAESETAFSIAESRELASALHGGHGVFMTAFEKIGIKGKNRVEKLKNEVIANNIRLSIYKKIEALTASAADYKENIPVIEDYLKDLELSDDKLFEKYGKTNYQP